MSTENGRSEPNSIRRAEQKLSSDNRSVNELIARALIEMHSGQDSRKPNDFLFEAMYRAGRIGEDGPSEALAVLQHRGSEEVFEAAKRLCANRDPKERELGATILGQNLVFEKSFPEEKFDILFGLLENDTNTEVLSAACYSLGHIGDPRSIKPVANLKNHPSTEVRFSVVQGMLGQTGKLAIRTLIELSADEDPDIRDWATFGLGSQIDTNTREVREALAARLEDTHEDTRQEAIVGLGLRKDRRALEPLRIALEGDSVNKEAFEAAAALGDPSLVPALLEWRVEGEVNESLEEAIKACGGRPYKGD